MRNSIYFLFVISLITISCSKTIDNTGTCTDGIQNQGEQGIDCGGTCNDPCPTCADGIMNQDEEAVDCGGQCDPCFPRLSAFLNGYYWSSTSRNAFISGPGTIRMYGTDQFQNITLFYSGPFQPGNTITGPQFTGELRDENGTLYTSLPGGKIVFTTFDTVAHTVSGSYYFNAKDQVSGITIPVLNGVFTGLSY